MTTQNLLIELFVEELPPKALKKLGQAFGEGLAQSLKAQDLLADGSGFKVFATPRRLAARVTQAHGAAADRAVQHKLMPASVGLSADGKATPALLKKLAALGVEGEAVAATVPQLKRVMDGKAETLFLEGTAKGATLAQGLQKALSETLSKLPIPKVMSYQLEQTDGSADFQAGWTSVNFVRPAHGLVALFGKDVVPVQALGLQSGRQTKGHRFEAKQPHLDIEHADDYEALLASEGAVVASFDERRAMIVSQLNAAAQRCGQALGKTLKPIDDDALLDEVTALVEKPNVLVCEFEKEFLDVPQECLILTMKANQKYFPLLDEAGKLTNQFLIVSNIAPQDASAVIQGNERVVRPRLADAKFFFDQDRKKTLASRIEGLGKVVYHNKLGTQGARSQRVGAIAHAVVNQLRQVQYPFTVQAKDEFDVLDSKTQEAARLAKTDLLTDMVGEFPELQGIMGNYYARHEGLRDGVAIAIEDHYKPRFAGDALPRNNTGTVLALADKLETLVGMFGIGNLPTGDKDPFALRRHALGVIRLLIEKNLPLNLPELLANAAQTFVTETGEGLLPDASASNAKLLTFIDERLNGYLRELGATSHEADAVIAAQPAWGQIPQRLAAVRHFATLPEAPALAAANKRIGNILKKSDASAAASSTVDAALLTEKAEQDLYAAMQTQVPQANTAFDEGQYTASLQTLAALRAPVDAFFEDVMVNAEDAALRNNRLALLQQLHTSMNRVADLAKLAT